MAADTLVSGSYGEKDAPQEVTEAQTSVELNESTYQLYSDCKVKAGFKNDNDYVNHLIKSAEAAKKGASAQQEFNVTSGTTAHSAMKRSHEGEGHRVSFNELTLEEQKGNLEKLSLKESPDELDSELHSCERCGLSLDNAEQLEAHKLKCGDLLSKYLDVKSKLPDTRKFIYCRLCGMRCSDRTEHKMHEKRFHSNHPNLHSCKYCNKKQTFTDKKLLLAHYKTEPVCPSCEKRFNQTRNLQLHLLNKRHDKTKQKEKLRNVSKRKMVHVPPVVEVMKKSEQPNLPSGFSFMSVKLNPLHQLPEPDRERVVIVPETSYRHGYTLRADFNASPYPDLSNEEGDSYLDDISH